MFFARNEKLGDGVVFVAGWLEVEEVSVAGTKYW